MTVAGVSGLAELVLASARTRGWSLATAESLTGGLLSAAIVSVPGASDVFRGGVVSYDTALKATSLGVDAALLAERGAVDAEVASQMALGAREFATIEGVPADVGLATTGVAGPTEQDGHPVGEVFVAVSTPDVPQSVRRLALRGSRDEIREQAVEAVLALALDLLRA